MAILKEQILQIREEIDKCKKPFILFDDDCDGLSSFLMIYNHKKVGKGLPIKSLPEVTEEYARKVNEYEPDLIIILDMPIVSQEFLNAVHAKVIWIDHHQLIERQKVSYYNPRTNDQKDNRPTSYWIYQIIQDHLWIGMCGMIGDWFMPEDEIKNKYSEMYPDLLPSNFKRPEDALHNSKIGEMIRVIEFNMKGKITDIVQSVKVFSRIKNPYEILKQETAAGKFIYKKFLKFEKEYQAAIKETKKAMIDTKTLIFLNKDNTGANSFSTQISNYLIYHHPEKLILVAWEHEGEFKCSLRSTKHNLPKIIKKALDQGVKGYGGGHEFASGACIKSEDFNKFIEIIKSEA